MRFRTMVARLAARGGTLSDDHRENILQVAAMRVMLARAEPGCAMLGKACSRLEFALSLDDDQNNPDARPDDVLAATTLAEVSGVLMGWAALCGDADVQAAAETAEADARKALSDVG